MGKKRSLDTLVAAEASTPGMEEKKSKKNKKKAEEAEAATPNAEQPQSEKKAKKKAAKEKAAQEPANGEAVQQTQGQTAAAQSEQTLGQKAMLSLVPRTIALACKHAQAAELPTASKEDKSGKEKKKKKKDKRQSTDTIEEQTAEGAGAEEGAADKSAKKKQKKAAANMPEEAQLQSKEGKGSQQLKKKDKKRKKKEAAAEEKCEPQGNGVAVEGLATQHGEAADDSKKESKKQKEVKQEEGAGEEQTQQQVEAGTDGAGNRDKGKKKSKKGGKGQEAGAAGDAAGASGEGDMTGGDDSKDAKKTNGKANPNKLGREDASPAPPDAQQQGAGQPSSAEMEQQNGEGASGKRKGSPGIKAFQRVKAEEWLDKKGAWDNSYEGTFGQNGWGYKAQQALGAVRGKDFRHEKTKKKRGTYRGGTIDVGSNSYKFDSDDE